ncbi:glycosyltransferase family 2 protein [Microbacterium sp. EYE_5]|uniref:glycosyltransferase family 2 protein n=1 Tax=unclassified Microbacterium TaxID=2609290 RepID=UPI002003BCAA|nr:MULTISPECIES: glycosyltransferase family 2 protein [unclassified Microbacterium]MCK6079107.1 glycosyltransferase family 2 protein [Microbacterium sp. EYE_382]MCK6084377.1 glycosyltransferase family 2 protein [Microbacterium sp. EYE_384]MCK6123394.1 glycosyltransferase family 2 protein [Microbacterium sp. EYE_80]MCK6125141.1 glycosyltransferase family 2 protein [Microbacterium sp. EYE_79]MCK6140061.1 glycosyltransferase family 2 protein [Microbacterium sp. EYE_39]
MPDSNMSLPSVDVVVPVYGGWTHVEPCIDSLLSQSHPVTVFVVDDASPDDTADRIEAHFPGVTVLRNDENSGFARSCNAGIRAGHGEVVILVNSDVEAAPDMAETIARSFARDERAGSSSPLLLQPDGRVDAYGVTADPTLAGFVRFHGADAQRVDSNDPISIGPYGALAGYRRTAIEDVGLLDENIFMYGEELELAFRLAASGWACASIPRALGSHIGAASAGRGSRRQRRLAGFGRGYTLRVYGVLRGRYALRAAFTEALVCMLSAIRDRDLQSLIGRAEGWREGKGLPRRTVPLARLAQSISLRASLRMRLPGYWAQRDAS